jgi:hypothetical protein
MRNVEITNKSSMLAIADAKIEKGFIPKRSDMIQMVAPFIGGRVDSKDLFDDMEKAQAVGNSTLKMSQKILDYGGAFFIPKMSATASSLSGKKVEMSAYDMLQAGYFTETKMSGNTLPADWNTLWNALKIDISIRKAAQPTVRETMFNVISNQNASKIIDVVELYGYANEFTLNNGEGQGVVQGETRGGQSETIEHFIYATGFTRTLLSELYDNSYDPQKVMDSVMLAYNAKRDDISISPILDFSYVGVPGSQTPADATSGATRQELLFNTIENAIDHLSRRVDPTSLRKVIASDLTILCENEDARHIQRVVNGLTTPQVGGQDTPKILPPITQISNIVSYDGEVIPGRIKDIIYTGVTRGKAYLIKKNRYMNISEKRGLTLESDMQPDVTTLARKKESWYYVEGQQTTGIEYFVQEITLPTYTPAPTS